MRDSLATLLRLRRHDVRSQICDLASAIQAEEQACRAHLVCTEALANEAAEARSLAVHNGALAGFTHWHAGAAQALKDAAARIVQSAEATRAARALLGNARGAMRAVDLAIDRRDAIVEQTTQRLAQHALDDATRRPSTG